MSSSPSRKRKSPEASPGASGPDPVVDPRAGADRRRGERRKQQVPVGQDRRAGAERRKGDRRTRNINQYDMSPDELEFVNAVIRFREQSGNRFPAARDILRILRDLGYEKQ